MLHARSAIFIQPSLPSPTSILPLYRPRFYGKNPPPIDHAMQGRVLVVQFWNHHINTSAYEQIPISGQHTQILEFDSVWFISSLIFRLADSPFFIGSARSLIHPIKWPCKH